MIERSIGCRGEGEEEVGRVDGVTEQADEERSGVNARVGYVVAGLGRGEHEVEVVHSGAADELPSISRPGELFVLRLLRSVALQKWYRFHVGAWR